MAEPAVPQELPQGGVEASKAGLQAPEYIAKAAPTAGLGAEAPTAGGLEGPPPEASPPLNVPEIGGAAPSTPARAAPLGAAPTSPVATGPKTAAEAAAAPVSPRRSAAGRLSPAAYTGMAAVLAAMALALLLAPSLVGPCCTG